GNIYYYVDDFLGSTSKMVQAGQTTACFDADFYPFGGERDYSTSCNPIYKFEGKERDTETQNDDFGARYYSWRFGRWLSADWSAIPEPVPYADPSNPQTLNLYAMVRDNPETFSDLDGHRCNPDDGGSNCTSEQLSSNTFLCGFGQMEGNDCVSNNPAASPNFFIPPPPPPLSPAANGEVIGSGTFQGQAAVTIMVYPGVSAP